MNLTATIQRRRTTRSAEFIQLAAALGLKTQKARWKRYEFLIRSAGGNVAVQGFEALSSADGRADAERYAAAIGGTVLGPRKTIQR